MTYSWIQDKNEIFNWSNGETLNYKDIVNELNEQEEKLSKIYCLIEDKLDEVPHIVVLGNPRYKSVELMKSIYHEGYIKALEELKKELIDEDLL